MTRMVKLGCANILAVNLSAHLIDMMNKSCCIATGKLNIYPYRRQSIRKVATDK